LYGASTWTVLVTTASIVATVVAARPAWAQASPDTPAVTVRGQTYTPRSILTRNMGSDEDQTTAFPPHKIIGNVYYVGTKTLRVVIWDG
jgi:hypothetical protein